jgi:hypothetical protein
VLQVRKVLPLKEEMMSFQTAPYDELCGCVAAMIPTGFYSRKWDKGEADHDATRTLLENSQGCRVVDADCPKCHGFGLKPKG